MSEFACADCSGGCRITVFALGDGGTPPSACPFGVMDKPQWIWNPEDHEDALVEFLEELADKSCSGCIGLSV